MLSSTCFSRCAGRPRMVCREALACALFPPCQTNCAYAVAKKTLRIKKNTRCVNKFCGKSDNSPFKKLIREVWLELYPTFCANWVAGSHLILFPFCETQMFVCIFPIQSLSLYSLFYLRANRFYSLLMILRKIYFWQPCLSDLKVFFSHDIKCGKHLNLFVIFSVKPVI